MNAENRMSAIHRSHFSKLLSSPNPWRTALFGLGVFLTFFAGLALIQFSTPDLPDNDGFYHIKLAEIMRAEGLRPAFPWLPLTILNEREYYDHHFLFHVALIPFTFGDLRLGAKWAAVTFASLAFTSIWWLLRCQRVPFAFLWSLGLLAVSEAFLYRMSIPRAQSLSLAVIVLGLHGCLTRKYSYLAPLAFLYVWMYDAFPLLMAVAILYALAVGLLEKRLELRPMLYVGIGILLGLLINPYFPDDLVFIYRHLLPKLSEMTAVSVGSEWYPYNTSQLLENSFLALAVFTSGVVALGLQEKRMDTRTATSLFLALLFGLMLFQARRFVEYFPPFALIFAAFAWTPLIEAFRNRETVNPSPKLLGQSWQAWLVEGSLALLLITGTWNTTKSAQESMRSSKPYQRYDAASAWLEENTPAGSRVFQTDWDDFPRLFFYNTHNTYLVGLDPTYLQLYSEDLYDQWVEITDGKVSQPAAEIGGRFASSYVFTDLAHKAFIAKANEDPGLEKVYEDGDAVIYQVKR
jgi:hypothetical protein